MCPCTREEITLRVIVSNIIRFYADTFWKSNFCVDLIKAAKKAAHGVKAGYRMYYHLDFNIVLTAAVESDSLMLHLEHDEIVWRHQPYFFLLSQHDSGVFHFALCSAKVFEVIKSLSAVKRKW